MGNHLHPPVSGVAQVHDPEGDRLINLAATLGEENLSEGERWRLANTLDARRRREAQAAARAALEAAARPPPTPTSFWANQIFFPRRDAGNEADEALRTAVAWTSGSNLDCMFVALAAAMFETIDGVADLKSKLTEARDQTEAKIVAAYKGWSQALDRVRNEDRREIIADLRDGLAGAEVRIDAAIERKLEAEKERSEVELALVRDEVLAVISEKTYGQFTDDGPKLELAEKAIAGLRRTLKTMAKDEERRRDALNARHDALVQRIDAIEVEHREAMQKLFLHVAAGALAAKKEEKERAALAEKVDGMKETLDRLIEALIDAKVIK